MPSHAEPRTSEDSVGTATGMLKMSMTTASMLISMLQR